MKPLEMNLGYFLELPLNFLELSLTFSNLPQPSRTFSNFLEPSRTFSNLLEQWAPVALLFLLLDSGALLQTGSKANVASACRAPLRFARIPMTPGPNLLRSPGPPSRSRSRSPRRTGVCRPLLGDGTKATNHAYGRTRDPGQFAPSFCSGSSPGANVKSAEATGLEACRGLNQNYRSLTSLLVN